MDGAARVRAARERARMGLISVIVFAVSQSVEERTTLLGGGGEVTLLYTLDISYTMHIGASNSILSIKYSAPLLGRIKRRIV